MECNTVLLLLMLILLLVLVVSLMFGSRHLRWWSNSGGDNVEGFADKPVLTPREQELFEDLANNRLSESEVTSLVNSGIINDNLISKFLHQLDVDTMRDHFEDVAEQDKRGEKLGAPDTLSTAGPKASFYMEPNYTGNMFRLTPGNYDNLKKGPIGSVRTPSSLQVTLYDQTGFKGNSAVITENTPNMRNFKLQNVVASVKVERVAPGSTPAPAPSNTTTVLPAQMGPPSPSPPPPSPPSRPAASRPQKPLEMEDDDEDDDEEDHNEEEPRPRAPNPPRPPPRPRQNSAQQSEQIARLVVEPFCGGWGVDYAAKL